MNAKKTIVLATCSALCVVVACGDVLLAQTAPPQPPSAISGTQAPPTSGADATLSQSGATNGAPTYPSGGGFTVTDPDPPSSGTPAPPPPTPVPPPQPPPPPPPPPLTLSMEMNPTSMTVVVGASACGDWSVQVAGGTGRHSYAWTGGGSTTSTDHYCQSYGSAGTYSLVDKVTVSDADGDSRSIAGSITVNVMQRVPPPPPPCPPPQRNCRIN